MAPGVPVGVGVAVEVGVAVNVGVGVGVDGFVKETFKISDVVNPVVNV